MQPPDTDPTTCPSSRTASNAPGGRGELPQVLTTVTSSTRLPAASHSALLRSTSKSTLSMRHRKIWLGSRTAGVRQSFRIILRRAHGPVDNEAYDDQDSQGETQPHRPRNGRGLLRRRHGRRHGHYGGGRASCHPLHKAGKKILGNLGCCAVDQP